MKKGYTISYGSANSILLVNGLGRIRQLYTPFRVKVTEDVEGLKQGTFVYVEEVVSDPQDRLVFITNTGAYLHSSFRIVASF
jgi:hypothetical protein